MLLLSNHLTLELPPPLEAPCVPGSGGTLVLPICEVGGGEVKSRCPVHAVAPSSANTETTAYMPPLPQRFPTPKLCTLNGTNVWDAWRQT